MTYNKISIDNWLVCQPYNSNKKTVIGFKSTYNYFIKPIEYEKAMNVKNVKFIRLLYDPYEINKNIYELPPPVVDERSKTLSYNLYNKYLYNILILQFIEILDTQKNNSLRKKIINLIENYSYNNDTLLSIKELLSDFPEDYSSIKKLIINNLSRPNVITKKNIDTNFISRKILSKTEIILLIKDASFDFDKVLLSKLKSMDHKKLVKELMDIFSKITINKAPKNMDSFSNILSSCNTKNVYCEGKKLLIKKDMLKDLLDVMASDILNPMKSKYLFNTSFVRNNINYFKFIIRDYENIVISI
jgi:hypothetical protein